MRLTLVLATALAGFSAATPLLTRYVLEDMAIARREEGQGLEGKDWHPEEQQKWKPEGNGEDNNNGEEWKPEDQGNGGGDHGGEQGGDQGGGQGNKEEWNHDENGNGEDKQEEWKPEEQANEEWKLEKEQKQEDGNKQEEQQKSEAQKSEEQMSEEQKPEKATGEDLGEWKEWNENQHRDPAPGERPYHWQPKSLATMHKLEDWIKSQRYGRQ